MCVVERRGLACQLAANESRSSAPLEPFDGIAHVISHWLDVLPFPNVRAFQIVNPWMTILTPLSKCSGRRRPQKGSNMG
jgi:hypothetical protein